MQTVIAGIEVAENGLPCHAEADHGQVARVQIRKAALRDDVQLIFAAARFYVAAEDSLAEAEGDLIHFAAVGAPGIYSVAAECAETVDVAEGALLAERAPDGVQRGRAENDLGDGQRSAIHGFQRHMLHGVGSFV